MCIKFLTAARLLLLLENYGYLPWIVGPWTDHVVVGPGAPLARKIFLYWDS